MSAEQERAADMLAFKRGFDTRLYHSRELGNPYGARALVGVVGVGLHVCCVCGVVGTVRCEDHS